MRSRLRVGIGCGVVAILAVGMPVLRAQAGGGIFVTPIPNAPFSGTVRVERTVIQPNGNNLQLWSEREIARDNQGRIYNEFRPFVPTTTKTLPDATVIHLYDPQNRMTEYLYPQRKTYQVMILGRPPATDTPDDFASPTAAAGPTSEFTRQEDLGYRTIAGLQVHGVSITQTLTAAESGTGQQVTVTNEYWYSEALRLNLVTKHNDPRTGSLTMTVTQIDRHEPSAALFGVRANYRMAGLGKPSGR
ncbi:hypothetical protein HNQ77_000617 [Silvibacterium bohemicum]|uniref:Uncharacterized protein n=1 Tax=Silvibacterium bohemicum TaxID=1577686 RepID=A0A841JSD4_9BACT|nr:hypothetical protein [Silvibacterium bohemicum]MBB6142679.1 hypothetical protein [Silvibacterium bohemicum]